MGGQAPLRILHRAANIVLRTTRRFISSDAYLSTGQGVLGHNSYVYCLNNPLLLDDQGGAAAHFNNMFAVNDGGGGRKRASINNSFATANQEKDRFLKYIWRNKLNGIYDFVVVKEKNEAQFLIEEAYQDILSIATLNELNFFV